VASQTDQGLLVGLLIGEGHFGGDGKQPHVVLRMHVRHQTLFAWIERAFPGGRLYGPYNHGGRHYFQWMARGTFLRDTLMPVLEGWLSPELDGHSWERFQRMKATYTTQLRPPGPPVQSPTEGPGPRALPHGGAPVSRPRRAPGGGTDRATEIFEQLRQDGSWGAVGPMNGPPRS
jgi:hypothetical protein